MPEIGSALRCPNCSAQLKLDGFKAICPYCGSEFDDGIDDETAALSEENAVRRLFKRAMAGDADAQYELGNRLVTGMGVNRSFSQGHSWLLQAQKQGHQKAKEALISFYETGALKDPTGAIAPGRTTREPLQPVSEPSKPKKTSAKWAFVVFGAIAVFLYAIFASGNDDKKSASSKPVATQTASINAVNGNIQGYTNTKYNYSVGWLADKELSISKTEDGITIEDPKGFRMVASGEMAGGRTYDALSKNWESRFDAISYRDGAKEKGWFVFIGRSQGMVTYVKCYLKDNRVVTLSYAVPKGYPEYDKLKPLIHTIIKSFTVAD